MSLPVLNLLNFEIPSANKCKYVLTSPRSLKACRKAGIKPVELLYKSASEFERKTARKENAQILFQAYEKERQRKLALCRSIRNQFLLHGYSLIKDTRHNHNTERGKRYSPKLQEMRERALPAIRECYLRKRAETPENMRNAKEQSTEQLDRLSFSLPKVNVAFQPKSESIHKESKQKDEKSSIEKMSILESSSAHEAKVKKPEKKFFNKTEVQMGNIAKENDFKISFETSEHDSSFTINPSVNGQKVTSGIEEEKEKHLQEAEEINNNVKVEAKRPSSACRRKTKETKRKNKAMEQKKLIQNLKIQYSDPEYCIQKYKQVIENSIERNLKELEVHKVQRELEEGMEKWQDRVLLLQWLDVNRARDQATRELEVKLERLQQKSRAKSVIHMMNINKVKEAEDMKAEGLRRQVEDKDRKIHSLQQEKERIIGESKSRALSIQELKDHIRSIMTPETFDQKVAKQGMHKRVLDSHMCARVMQRSHIWLG